MGKEAPVKTGSDNKPKRIIIALSCHFALTGLRELCQPLKDCSVQTLQIAPETVAEELMFNHADLLITELPRDAAGLAELLLIPEWFKGNTLIMLDEENRAMRRTLLDAGFGETFIKADLLNRVQSLINQQLQQKPKVIDYHMVGRNALIREKRVICALLRGMKPARIAQEMGLHPREISRSKVNCLARSGFPSLNAMLACTSRRSI